MGRIKGFFCSFCLEGRVDHANGEPAFDRNIDVSHLATPHVTSSPTVAVDRSLTPQTSENSTEDRYSANHFDSSQQPSNSNSFSISAPQHHNHYQQSQPGFNQNSNHVDEVTPHVRPGSSIQRDTNPSRQSSPPCPASSSTLSNPYVPQAGDHNEPAPIELQNNEQQHDQQQRQPQEHSPPNNPQPPAPPAPLAIARNSYPSTSNGTATKLSYDIISVREPLAKILAERQQLLLSQQQQRQILGDHEYIEVYGERGSSCFYEEIAGSVTSSATYDQIGAASNHNYQVLINAYANANRPPAVANQINHEANHTAQNAGPARNSNELSSTNNNQDQENAYDVTSHPTDTTDGLSSSADFTAASSDGQTPSVVAGTSTSVHIQSNSNDSDGIYHTQSIPVYSVINKATRRTNSIMRATFDDNRPPKPPPKNLFVSHLQPTTSAMIYEEASNMTRNNPNSPSTWGLTPHAPSTSSYLEKYQTNDDSESTSFSHRNNRLPQPPPRHSKNSAFNHTADRPLPSPNSNLDKLNNNNNQTLDQNIMNRDDDIESINNGYELLRSNLEDDQMDVGYEKIRESNRYSGGSISSQFYSRQFLDNGGYESVQPIYSSPSNCYEVLNPATASEIAAAAAAKLNVMEKYLNKDQ